MLARTHYNPIAGGQLLVNDRSGNRHQLTLLQPSRIRGIEAEDSSALGIAIKKIRRTRRLSQSRCIEDHEPRESGERRIWTHLLRGHPAKTPAKNLTETGPVSIEVEPTEVPCLQIRMTGRLLTQADTEMTPEGGHFSTFFIQTQALTERRAY